MFPRPPALAALALLLLGGCGSGEPTAASPLVVISGPKSFVRFELRDDQQVIWSVVSDEPLPVAELVYGVVPAGFRQEAPRDGAEPRELILGEPLTLDSVTPRRSFRHEGFVDTGRRLSIDRWGMELRQPPAPPVVDGEPPPP